ncbi:MAG: HEAT repeat domain-containing protein [Elusimicrobiales bacterium]
MPIAFLILLISFSLPEYTRAQVPAASPDRAEFERSLADKDFRNRSKALAELAPVKAAWKLEILKKSLEDENPEISQRAARLIARSGDPSAFQTLALALPAAGKQTRLGLLTAFGDLGDKRAVALLLPFLSEGDRQMRWKAAEVLGKLGSDTAVEPLRKAAAEDKDRSVRRAAVESLGGIGSPAARAALESLRSGGDAQTALWAGNVLRSIGAE